MKWIYARIATLVFALTTVTLVALGQRLVIEGRYTGEEGTMIYLKEYTDRNFVLLDSARTSRGRFFFNREAVDVVAYGLTSSKTAKQPPLFFAGADTLRIRLDESQNRLEVKGSATDSLYRLIFPHITDSTFSIVALSKRLPASPLVPYIALRHFGWQLSLADLQTMRANLDTVLKPNRYYQQFERLVVAREGLQVGEVAPNFQVRSAQGRLTRLTDFRGRPVVLNFWASWCGDCRREIPMLVKAHELLAERGVQFVGVSMDTSAKDWLACVERYKMAWTQLSDLRGWDSSVVPPYALRWVPTTYILDAEGRILSVSYNEQELRKHLVEAFNIAF